MEKKNKWNLTFKIFLIIIFLIILIISPKKNFQDSSNANKPELFQGMIPMVYNTNGDILVADSNAQWYNYSNHNWANAVLVNCQDENIKTKYFDQDMHLLKSMIGKKITLDDILEMYVWIPRFKYQIWNANNESSKVQKINIIFENNTTEKSTGTTNGSWLTHPAFTFGDTELNGFWVGKFENSGSTDNLIIKPNTESLTNLSIGKMFNATRNIELNNANNYGLDSTTIDTHMMKNMEWGAVAYLSSSIYGRYNSNDTCISSGCRVWQNNVDTLAVTTGPTITGCSGDSAVANTYTANQCMSGYEWNEKGVNASTTGNIYGIYDMAGGAIEYVMANMEDNKGNFYPALSELTNIDSKYYDSYAYDTNRLSTSRGYLGDATKETIERYGNGSGGWNQEFMMFPLKKNPWFSREDLFSVGSEANLFGFWYTFSGGPITSNSFRTIISNK